MDSWGAICVYLKHHEPGNKNNCVSVACVCVCVVVHDLEMKQVDLKTQNTE